MPRLTRKRKLSVTHWSPLALYSHQQDALTAYQSGLTRFFLAWHRRAGKDVFSLDFARGRAFDRVGMYWHLFPFHVQARRAIWKGIDARTGQRFIDRAFPEEIRSSVNDTEMSITFTNGSVWQMLGSDNYDRHIGANPCGIIFSEWALCDPAAWEYLRPILLENKGWAMFITTFRGCNHAYRMYQTVKDNAEWYTDLRTILQTQRNDGTPIIDADDVQKEIAEGMDPALAQQEFYCNPSSAISGAIFNRQHTRLMSINTVPVSSLSDNRITRVAWGAYQQGIAAVVFRDETIIAVHTFNESNYVDAVQSVIRRHPYAPIVHYAIQPDPLLFNSLDGSGVVASRINGDTHANHGHVASILNRCKPTAIAREALADFAMSFAPFRNAHDDTDITHGAVCEALAVTNAAQPLLKAPANKPLDYSRYDRGVI